MIAVCDIFERRQNYYHECINECRRGNRRNYNRYHCGNENNKYSQNNPSLCESNICHRFDMRFCKAHIDDYGPFMM